MLKALKSGTIIFLLLFFSCSPQESYDLVIQGGRIVDGTGATSYEANIGIVGNRIVKISNGQLKLKKGGELIDAKGYIVSPGFIDMHTNVEVNIQDYPLAENFIRQGITSIMASLHSGDQAYPLEAYASQLEIAPNIGYFAGHSWIRKQVLGLENRQASPEELDRMRDYVEQSMQQGALGLSTGLEYVPANYASEEEIIELAKVAAKYNGVYFTHMRDEGSKLLESIRESIQLGKAANIPVEINHLKAAGQNQWTWSERALILIDSARESGIQIHADIYPYTAFSTYSSILIPQWAMAGGRKGLKRRVRNPDSLERIKSGMEQLFLSTGGGEDLSKIQFRAFPYDASFDGKTMKDYAESLGLAPTLKTGVELLLELELKGGFIGIFHAMSEEDLENFISDPEIMFDSDGDLLTPGLGHPHPRCYGTFPKILSTYVRDKKLISLEEAIRRMTSLAAEKIRQKDIGRIEEGAISDIVVFDLEEIEDRSSYTDPHHFPKGIKHLLVNGAFVIKDEELSGKKPGRWLRRNQEHESFP